MRHFDDFGDSEDDEPVYRSAAIMMPPPQGLAQGLDAGLTDPIVRNVQGDPVHASSVQCEAWGVGACKAGAHAVPATFDDCCDASHLSRASTQEMRDDFVFHMGSAPSHSSRRSSPSPHSTRSATPPGATPPVSPPYRGPRAPASFQVPTVGSRQASSDNAADEVDALAEEYAWLKLENQELRTQCSSLTAKVSQAMAVTTPRAEPPRRPPLPPRATTAPATTPMVFSAPFRAPPAIPEPESGGSHAAPTVVADDGHGHDPIVVYTDASDDDALWEDEVGDDDDDDERVVYRSISISDQSHVEVGAGSEGALAAPGALPSSDPLANGVPSSSLSAAAAPTTALMPYVGGGPYKRSRSMHSELLSGPLQPSKFRSAPPSSRASPTAEQERVHQLRALVAAEKAEREALLAEWRENERTLTRLREANAKLLEELKALREERARGGPG